MIGRVRESRNPKKVIRVALMESYGEIRRVPVNLYMIVTEPSFSRNRLNPCLQQLFYNLQTAFSLFMSF